MGFVIHLSIRQSAFSARETEFVLHDCVSRAEDELRKPWRTLPASAFTDAGCVGYVTPTDP